MGLCIDAMISKDGQEEGKRFTDGWGVFARNCKRYNKIKCFVFFGGGVVFWGGWLSLTTQKDKILKKKKTLFVP